MGAIQALSMLKSEWRHISLIRGVCRTYGFSPGVQKDSDTF